MIKVDEAQIVLEQAQIHWQAKEWQLTIEACAKALVLDRDLAQAHKLMGDALQKTGKAKEAVGYYEQAIAIQPNFAKVYVNLGSLYANQKQWQKAVGYYQQALTINPELLGIHEHLARILQLQEQQPKVPVEPTPRELTVGDYLRQGKALKEQGKFKEALEQYHQAGRIFPRKVEIYQEIVDLSERLGLWQEAAKYCRIILQLSGSSLVTSQNKILPPYKPQVPELSIQPRSAVSTLPDNRSLSTREYLTLAEDAIDGKKYKQAIAYYHRAIGQQPNSSEAYLGMAKLLTKSGAREQAISCYLQGLKQVQDNPEIYYRLGNLYQRSSKWSQAAVCYQKAVQYAPDYGEAHHELGEVLSHQEQWSDAIISYRQAILYNPDFSWSYNNLGYALIQVGQWQEAIPVYQKAIELNPDFSWSYFNLAEAYSMLNRWSEAVDFYEQTSKIQPDLPKLQQKLGNALYRRSHKDLSKALKHFLLAIEQEPQDLLAYHQAIAIDKTNLELYLKLGDALVNQGQLEEGIVTYQMALQFHPQNPDLTSRLKEALQKKTLIMN
ncbi:tetratricopeptide repeat protein [Waterburya agarophytonicola K14]|uniref:Tetratricopeptide repeat protein n=1 Tax=Waterburya agarophytonicola KI4 TaxID=2874699 RepID=A0A964FF11_9CYAN|nr:tetratricopeptide repeat protein [Waterburya agarophytonicola]MCC0177250.1 tetratricopeptide repeat protein [Waterburya agarophytonicola KI4]